MQSPCLPQFAIALFALLSCSSRALSDDLLDWHAGAVGISQALNQLQTTGVVLHVVAHPDDEDGPLLTYCARGLGTRTVLFSITRGEGGANLISGDFFDRLGVLRTLEHQKSASYYGNQLYYSHAVDYGFSKTLDEAKRQWQSGEPILADLVEVIRRERPTVILSRFRGDARDGHGHHQMAGVVSQLAFDAAADPTRFPEQLERGLRPWQAAKLYANNIRPDWREEDRDAWTIAVPTGEYGAWLGRSYAEIARFGLGFQRSQGFGGHEGEAGHRPSYYRLARTSLADYAPRREQQLFEGLDTTLKGFARRHTPDATPDLLHSLEALDANSHQALLVFGGRNPEELVPVLGKGLSIVADAINAIDTSQIKSESKALLREELLRKQSQLHQAIIATLGIQASAVASIVLDPQQEATGANLDDDVRHVTPGAHLSVRLRIVQRSQSDVELVSARWLTPDSWSVTPISLAAQPLLYNEPIQSTLPITVPTDAQPTRAAYHRESIRQSFYQTIQPGVLTTPLPPAPLQLQLDLQLAGHPFLLTLPVDVRFRDPELGDIRAPLTIVPPVSVSFSLAQGIIPAGVTTYPVDVTVSTTHDGNSTGTVYVELPAEWSSEPETAQWTFSRDGQSQSFRFQLKIPSASDVQPERIALHAVAETGGLSYREGFVTVTARDLARANWYRAATHSVEVVDVKMRGTPRVGYINGSGDDVAKSLGPLGVFPTILSDEDLASANLAQFDVILVGVRAYAVRDSLREHNSRLLEFVHQGGVLIVQYQTPEFDHNFGPYPYRMGRSPEEVSEEDAKVTILNPHHPIWNQPNKITAKDFDGWVEQRGSKFLAEWDDHYEPLLECHDSGQPEQRGGMVIAPYGKGHYVYSAYAWYRQLPEGVPGAYRIIANLLSVQ